MRMEQIELSNGIQYATVGLGMWDTYEDEAINATSRALQLGYRRIDTAMYYKNEVEVGKGIRKSGIPREDIFVSTKIWYTDMQEDNVRKTCMRSLKNLDLSYIDLYMLHWPMGDVKGSWKVLEELYEEGTVKAIGVCNFQKHHLDELMKTARIKPMVNQIESHPTFSQSELVSYCKEEGIQPEVWSPLGRGDDLTHPEILKLGKKHEKTPAQIILRWHLQRGVSMIPKSVKEHRMKENVDIFDFELTKEEMKVIDQLETGKPRGGYPDIYQWK